MEQVTKKYQEGIGIFAANLSIRQGESVLFVGESGSGKTTLAKLIMGLISPDSGRIRLQGEPLPRLEARSFQQKSELQYIFQDPYSALEPSYTIAQTLEETVRICARNQRPCLSIEQAMQQVDATLATRLGDRVALLSGGQRQKLCIARALIPKPSLMIADECTSMLDEASSQAVFSLLSALQKKQGIGLIYIAHEVDFSAQGWDTLVVFKEGHIVEQGAFSTFLQTAQHPYSQSLLEAYRYYTVR